MRPGKGSRTMKVFLWVGLLFNVGCAWWMIWLNDPFSFQSNAICAAVMGILLLVTK